MKDAIEDVISDADLPYSHLSKSDGDVVVWYDDGTDDDDVTLIVQTVERSGVATYQGEKQYPHDDVTGLVFSEPDGLPIDVQDAATSIIEACRGEQEGEIIVPVAAIDEAEMPKRLSDEVHQSVWDAARNAIIAEIEARGYYVD